MGKGEVGAKCLRNSLLIPKIGPVRHNLKMLQLTLKTLLCVHFLLLVIKQIFSIQDKT